MIKIQNAIYSQKHDWSNQMVPTSKWDDYKATSLRPYWGWNEVPVDGASMDNPQNWDAIYIKLPAAVCGGGTKDSVTCLSSGAAQQLEWDLMHYEQDQVLYPGVKHVNDKPGSAIIFLNDENHRGHHGDYFQRRFACEQWTSPNNKYKIVVGQGTCYIDYA